MVRLPEKAAFFVSRGQNYFFCRILQIFVLCVLWVMLLCYFLLYLCRQKIKSGI